MRIDSLVAEIREEKSFVLKSADCLNSKNKQKSRFAGLDGNENVFFRLVSFLEFLEKRAQTPQTPTAETNGAET